MTTDDPGEHPGYRSYEVYQRERVGETTNLLVPKELLSDEMLTDPFRPLTILREHYPCYRDWLSNRFWITRYDDVTSVFVDEANYESRSKLWRYGTPDVGRNLGGEPAVQAAITDRTDDALPAAVDRVVAGLADDADLATALAARVPLELLCDVLDLPADDRFVFAERFWRLQRGAGWDPVARRDGVAAMYELVEYFEPLVAARRAAPGDDVVSVAAGLDVDGGLVTAADVVVTLLESDHETLHGGLANMWFSLLTVPGQLDVVRDDRRLVKQAWLETLRHSPAVLGAERFARHEVERFGRLIPAGALLYCSAAAANRDPRAFAEPDDFRVDRKDLCQREPRGQYRADGLASGIAFGLGPPSPHPAEPKERPRSRYALTRDVAVAASHAVLDVYPAIRLADGAEPSLRSLRHGEMRTCWSLPVRLT